MKQKSFYKKGKLNGKTTDYYEDGNILSKGDFDNGLGFITYFFPNGTKQKEGEIENNKEHGFWTYYFENGKIKSQGSFRNGKMDGPYKVYGVDGEVIETGIYKDGQVIQKKG